MLLYFQVYLTVHIMTYLNNNLLLLYFPVILIELLSSAYRPVELELIHVESGSVNIRRLLFRATGTSTGTHLFYIMFAVL